MGKMSRDKGQRGERLFASKCKTYLCVDAKRGLQSRGGGKETCDVVWEGSPWHFEVKTGKKPNVRAALKQAAEDAKNGRLQAVIIKDDHKEPFIAMPEHDWFMMAAAYWSKVCKMADEGFWDD